MSTSDTGLRAFLAPRYALPMAGISGGVLLHALNAFIVQALLPTAVTEIGGVSYYALNTTAYVLASIIGAASASRLLGRAGPRGAYVIAALVFTAGSVMCALAPSMPVLISGRFLQGGGGGLLLSLSYALVRLSFPAPLRPAALAIEATIWGVATALGPAIGGWFAGAGSWRVPFWLQVPGALVVIILALAVFPTRDKDAAVPAPVAVGPLALLLGAIVVASSVALVGHPAASLALLAAAAMLLTAFVRVERTATRRLLPHGALSVSGPFGALFALAAVLAAGITGCGVFMTYFLQVIHGQTPVMAGYLGVLGAVGWTLGSLGVSHWQDQWARLAILAAPLSMIIGVLILALAMPGTLGSGGVALAPVAVGTVLVGTGIGMGWPHLTTAIYATAPEGEADHAATSLATVQLTATALSAALVGIIANLAGLAGADPVAGAIHAAAWIYAVIALLPLLGIALARRFTAPSRPAPDESA